MDLRASLMQTKKIIDEMSDGKLDKKALHWQKAEQFLQTHEYIMNADVRELCGVTAERYSFTFLPELPRSV